MVKRSLSTREELMVWQSIRASIGVWDSLVMNLLTHGTTFLFAAFGVILGNAANLGDTLTAVLSFGLFAGTVALNLGVWRYSNSISRGVQAAKSIEDKLFGTGLNDPHAITNTLANHPLAAARAGRFYYLLWAGTLMLGTGALVIWRTCLVSTAC